MTYPHPPEFLEGGEVLSTLATDLDMKFTGALNLWVNGQKVGRLPHIAIVRNQSQTGLLIVHCDRLWNVVGVQAWNKLGGKSLDSILEAKRIVEAYYTNSLDKWIDQ